MKCIVFYNLLPLSFLQNLKKGFEIARNTKILLVESYLENSQSIMTMLVERDIGILIG